MSFSQNVFDCRWRGGFFGGRALEWGD